MGGSERDRERERENRERGRERRNHRKKLIERIRNKEYYVMPILSQNGLNNKKNNASKKNTDHKFFLVCRVGTHDKQDIIRASGGETDIQR